jgi:hypothetical protein
MSLDSLLLHTCTIENPATGALNAYNNETRQYGVPVTGVRCRLVEKSERVWSNELQEAVIQTVYLLLLPRDTVIEEHAKISLVTLEDRTTISDVFEVDELLTRRGMSAHHKTAMLKRIS